MSFNDLAKKVATDNKASQEEDTKSQMSTDHPPDSKIEATDP